MSSDQEPPDAPRPDGDLSPAAGTGGGSDAEGIDAAFQGEPWDTPRRRRSSSKSGSPSSSGRSSSGRSSSSGSSRSRSRSSSSPESTSSQSSSSPQSSSSRAPSSRRRSSSRRRLRHGRALLVHAVLGLLGLGLVWVAVTGAIAAFQLTHAKSDLALLRTQITTGDADAAQTAASLADSAHHAAVLTRGPAWSAVAAIPWVGKPFEAIRGITAQTDALVDGAAPGLVAVADDVNPRTVVKSGTVDVAALQRAAAPVHTASAVATAANGRVDALPRKTWLPVVDTATTQLASQLSDLDTTLHTADRALQVLPTMLGGDGRARKYFVAFQNNAELRGTGGLPGAFAIVSAVNGTVTIERFESDTVLSGRIPTGLDFGDAYNTLYGPDQPYTQYVDSNESPHFPYAAQIWCAMWTNISGEQLDGALTIDPGALSYLLAATGPVTAPDGVQVTAANVVALLQKDVYAQFPQEGENDDRRQYILDVASAAEKKILAGTTNARALLQGLSRGVDERRVLAWSSDTAVERVLGSVAIGGAVPATSQPFSMLSLNNGAAGKLDYYLGRSVTWARSGCGDTREVTVTITLKNNAPASGLPPYVTERIGLPPPAGFVPGQNRVVVDYLATNGAQLLGATLDGQTSGAGVFEDQGHPVFRQIVEIKPGASTTWVLRLQEPGGTEPVTVLKQPAVLPIAVDVDDRSCS